MNLDKRAIDHFDRTHEILPEARDLDRGCLMELAEAVREERPDLARELSIRADGAPEPAVQNI